MIDEWSTNESQFTPRRRKNGTCISAGTIEFGATKSRNGTWPLIIRHAPSKTIP
jgi:hypothetical protein